MSVLSDGEIIDLCTPPVDAGDDWIPMIKPFNPRLLNERVHTAPVINNGHMYDKPICTSKTISSGLTSYGYDVKLGAEFKLFTNINSTIIDPKRLDPKCMVDAVVKTDEWGDQYVIMPPNSYILGVTEEYFDIPRDILAICLGKSTYARVGAIVNVTPIEPGFTGNVVIEISNSTPAPLKIYVNEGCAQFLFFRGSKPCQVSYRDRKGKYQGQRGVTLAKV